MAKIPTLLDEGSSWLDGLLLGGLLGLLGLLHAIQHTQQAKHMRHRGNKPDVLGFLLCCIIYWTQLSLIVTLALVVHLRRNLNLLFATPH